MGSIAKVLGAGLKKLMKKPKAKAPERGQTPGTKDYAEKTTSKKMITSGMAKTDKSLVKGPPPGEVAKLKQEIARLNNLLEKENMPNSVAKALRVKKAALNHRMEKLSNK